MPEENDISKEATFEDKSVSSLILIALVVFQGKTQGIFQS